MEYLVLGAVGFFVLLAKAPDAAIKTLLAGAWLALIVSLLYSLGSGIWRWL